MSEPSAEERALLTQTIARVGFVLLVALLVVVLTITPSCGRPLTAARAACDVLELVQMERPDPRLERAHLWLKQGDAPRALTELVLYADELTAIEGARASSDDPLAPQPSRRQEELRALIALVRSAIERGDPPP